jgi:hypothetical protein
MDIAAFVGFATRGPIDVPVPVEDVARFRDVFGPPLELVRDRETGRTKTARLHRAVEAFFRNGGRRCWVVRVAQPKDGGTSSDPVERTSFGLPGLVSAETGRPSTMRARCYGATFDELRGGTVLRRRLLPEPTSVERAGDAPLDGGVILSWDASHRDPLEEDVLAEGDLTRLNFGQLRVSVSIEEASMGSEDPLLKLAMRLRTDLREEKTLRFEAVRGSTTSGEEISMTVMGLDGDDDPKLPPGQAGDSKRLSIEVEENRTDLNAFEFTLPASTLSILSVTDVITEETRTPNTAKTETNLTKGRFFAFAPVASQKRLVSDRGAGTQGSSLEVQTECLRCFDRAPPLHETAPPSVVEGKVQAPSESKRRSLPVSSRTFIVGRSRGNEESSGLRLTVITKKKNKASSEDENDGDGVDASFLEDRLVHLTIKGGRKGWFQLGEVTHRYDEKHEGEDAEKVDVKVRDALWPVSWEEVVLHEGGAPPPVCRAERQRFDLLAWEGQELQTRLDHLGFAKSHPRAWTDLPVDEDLFELQEGETVTPELGILRADVFEPRFPLASPASPDPGPFIPLGMADRPDPSRTRGRIPQTVERSRLEKERLSTFSTDVFVDGTFDKDGTGDDLAGTSTATLGEKADDMIFVDQKSASGLHSLWPIREATLLAVPDAVHRGWDEPETVTPDSLQAPSPLKMRVHGDTDPPRVHLKWTVDRLGDENVEVEVQEAQEPTFENPVVRYRGAGASVDRYVRSDDPITLFFRYRVVAGGQPGPWSNTRHTTIPEPDFDPCKDRPEVPDVSLHDQDGPNTDHWLRWAPQQLFPSSGTGDIDLNIAGLEELVTLPGVDEVTAGRIIEYRDARDESITNPLQLREVQGLTEQCIRTWEGRVEPPLRPDYEIQIATTPTFEAPKVVLGCAGKDCAEENEEKVEFQLSSPPPGTDSSSDQKEFVWYDLGRDPSVPTVRYVRMRALRPGASQMNSSGWSKTVVVTRKLREEPTVISAEEYDNPQPDTPGGGRQGLYDVHKAMLRFGAARGDVLSVLALPEQDQPDDAHRHVNRLRAPGGTLNYGEERTLSYGALYYPWLLGPVDDGERITPMPPDGAACGMIADRTLRDGAWMAPANQLLADVPTVVPPLSSDERAELGASPLNVFTETPDGVLTLGTATLARDPDLEPITTRRLLILVRRLAQREGPALVFENNTPLLRRRIAEQFDDVLRRLFDRGAFAGTTPSEGYRVVTDERVNPPGQVERGRLVVELRIAPARPLTFLTVRLVQRSGQRPTVPQTGATP